MQSVSALVRRYDAPRLAVLNALKILGSDGIVTQLPGRAWAFQPILDTPNCLSESLAFRLSLEPQAILSPWFSMDSQGVGMMRQQMESFEHFNLNPTQQLERYVAPTWDAIVDTVIHAEAGLQNLIRRIKPDGIVLDNVIMFPAIANAGVPWVRVVSCAETEIPDPNVPPYLSGMTADDKDRKAFDASYIACTARAHKRYSGFRQTCGLTSLPRGQFLETSDYLNLLLAPSAISLRVI